LNFHVHLLGFQGRSAKRPSSQTGVSVFNRCLYQITSAADTTVQIVKHIVEIIAFALKIRPVLCFRVKDNRLIVTIDEDLNCLTWVCASAIRSFGKMIVSAHSSCQVSIAAAPGFMPCSSCPLPSANARRALARMWSRERLVGPSCYLVINFLKRRPFGRLFRFLLFHPRVLAGGQQLTRPFPRLARGSERDGRVDAERESLLLACETVVQPPILADRIDQRCNPPPSLCLSPALAPLHFAFDELQQLKIRWLSWVVNDSKAAIASFNICFYSCGRTTKGQRFYSTLGRGSKDLRLAPASCRIQMTKRPWKITSRKR
jgi:hypothetical protein